MARKRLPIGIQDFETIRSEGFHYVDKTPLVRQLVDDGRHYFLSRPRRFGKSLLLDTIKALFEGRETLFRGLDIHDHWDWSLTHPVLRLSFDGKYNEPEDVERNVLNQMALIEHAAGLDPMNSVGAGPERLQTLLHRLHDATGQRVVILVDEYDKPILDALGDPRLARANRDYVRGLYGIIKGGAEHVRFTFVTGISMFSKASLFSGLNNLRDISLDPRYSTICGYTDEEIDTVFDPELDGLDRDRIRTCYNGYHWRGDRIVYNPQDVLLLLRSREFRPHWFETGSPGFLFETLKERSIGLMELEGRMADRSLLTTFDVDDIGVEALLFQTGYLTIAEEWHDGLDSVFRLDYPNLEVRVCLNRGLLAHLDGAGRDRTPLEEGRTLRALLEANDFDGFADRITTLLSSIPYQWHATGDLARYKAWYISILHMCFQAIEVDVRREEASIHGSADMVVRLGKQVFILEFRMVEDENGAADTLDATFSQMRERGYADRYCSHSVHFVAVACGQEARKFLEVRAEPIGSRCPSKSLT